MKPPMRAFVVVVVLAALAAAAGCLPPPLTARSSANLLGPDGSSAVVRRAPPDAAAELADLFAARGYPVVDQRQDGQVVVLRLAGSRQTIQDGKHARELGSAYYVFIAPDADGRSTVTIVGRPIYDGSELCTRDLNLGGDPCTYRFGEIEHELELDGRAEAALVRDVFSELRRRRAIDAAAMPSHRLALEHDVCRERRKEAIARALSHRDVRARAVAHARVTRDFAACE